MSNSPVEVSLEQLVKLSNKSGCREEPFLDGLKFRSPVGSDLRETFGHWCFFFFFFPISFVSVQGHGTLQCDSLSHPPY